MSEPETCPRCGHGVRHPVVGADRLKNALPGLKPERQACGAAGVEGWACPCHSRWHLGVRRR
jgi:hypothetical protein